MGSKGPIDETTLIEFVYASCVVELVDFDFADLGVLQFHQTMIQSRQVPISFIQ